MMPLSGMTSLAESINDYADQPWYGQTKSLSGLQDVRMVFSNGEGGYLYLDLRGDQSTQDDPLCRLVTGELEEPAEQVPL